jgi:hypothetical protein
MFFQEATQAFFNYRSHPTSPGRRSRGGPAWLIIIIVGRGLLFILDRLIKLHAALAARRKNGTRIESSFSTGE